MNNNPWQSTFGKVLIASSIIAAIAGFMIVNAFKAGSAVAVEQAPSNEALEMMPDEPTALDEQQPPVAVAEQAETEPSAEPAADQFSYDQQEVEQPATDGTTDGEGVQQ